MLTVADCMFNHNYRTCYGNLLISVFYILAESYVDVARTNTLSYKIIQYYEVVVVVVVDILYDLS